MSQTEQERLIGKHKTKENNIFSIWLDHDDKPTTDRKKHRELKEFKENRETAIEHLSEFSEYLENLKLFPTTDKTKKGNAIEILLAEYLKFSSDLDLLVYRLRYNPNVDQSMKGDDVLLLNERDLKTRILKGEAKFRKKPSKSAINAIIDSCQGTNKMPISISFVASILETKGETELSNKLIDLNHELYELDIPIINVGLLLSNHNTSGQVDKHTDSDNPDFVMLSLGVDNPVSIIEESYKLAYKKLKTDGS